MDRIFLRPRWILLHAGALLLVALFVGFGLWQLDRNADRRARNDLIRERRAMAPVDVTALPDDADPEELAWRPVEASGTYDSDEEVIWRNRSGPRGNGHHVLTPLVLPDGRAVIVDRGWVPFEMDEPPIADARPPSTEVTVSGLLMPEQRTGFIGPSNPESGELDALNRLDVARLDEQLPYPLVPNALLLQEQSPSVAGELPVPGDPPEIDAGPHLSYAIQWFGFAAIGAVGYAALVRREARKRAGPPEEPSEQRAGVDR